MSNRNTLRAAGRRGAHHPSDGWRYVTRPLNGNPAGKCTLAYHMGMCYVRANVATNLYARNNVRNMTAGAHLMKSYCSITVPFATAAGAIGLIPGVRLISTHPSAHMVADTQAGHFSAPHRHDAHAKAQARMSIVFVQSLKIYGGMCGARVRARVRCKLCTTPATSSLRCLR